MTQGENRIRRARWFHIVSVILLALLLVLLSLVYLVEDCYSEDNQTLVALTFDDGYSCWTSTVMPILTRYDLPATAFINDPDQLEDFTWTDVQELHSAGWEIGWHTAAHIDCTKANRSEIISDFNGCSLLFKSHGLPPPVAFAYPWGKHEHISREIVSGHFLAARTILCCVNSPCYLREHPARLTTINIKKGLPFVKRVVNRYSQQGVFVVFYAHTVGQVAEWQSCPEMTVQEFEDLARFLRQEEEDDRINVVTFGEGVYHMQQQENRSHWRLELDSPFNPWFKADILPSKRYSTLYDKVVHDFLEHRCPQIAKLFDRLIYGSKHVGFFLSLGAVSFIVVSIVVTIFNLRRKKI